jgi:capsular polysaccharide transport system permease protein
LIVDQQVRTVEQITAPAADREQPQVAHWIKRHLLFLITVVVPTLVATVYYGLIASDVYTSESRFLVRSPQPRMQTGLLGELLQGTGISRSQDDTYSVRDFILSRDALKELDEKLAVRQAYSSKRVDWFKRFPGLTGDDSFEALYRYYGKQVSIEYDSVSSISTLTVHAFNAKDSQNINKLLLDMSERLVNSLNDRSRNDLVRFAEGEVKSAEEQAKEASLALLAFRSKEAVFEPDKQAGIQLEGVAKLQEELISTEAQLAQLRRISPSNPQIAGLTTRAETLRAAATSEASKVTSGSGSLSARAATFERLAIESEFADKRLGIALAELEAARSEAARKQLYLERLVQPSLADKALEPRRFRSIVTALLMGLIVWGAVSLVLASVREHAD